MQIDRVLWALVALVVSLAIAYWLFHSVVHD
jgi:hypothetical protein